jgi:hypothetical protein
MCLFSVPRQRPVVKLGCPNHPTFINTCDRNAAGLVEYSQSVLAESALLHAMFDVGYFPPNTPPDE